MSAAQAEEVAEVPTVRLTGGWETVLEGSARQELERSVLPGFLRARRWFGGKARRVEAVRLADWGDLPAEGARAFPVLLEIAFADGGTDLYFLLLAVTAGGLDEALRPWMLARLTGPAGEAALHDALADDAVCTALLDAIGAGRDFRTRHGAVRSFATAAYPDLRGDPDARLEVVRGPATSSNSLVFYGRRLLLKLFRRLEVGINPDFEIGRFLTEASPFDRVPRVAGALEYHRPGAGPMTLAILQAFVPSQGDGWHYTVEELGRYFERASGPVTPDARPLPELAEVAPPPAAAEAIGGYLQTAATLGKRTAELHRALAADTGDPAFAPEPLTEADLDALCADIRVRGRQALTTLEENLDHLPEPVRQAARQLLENGPGVLEHLETGPAGASGRKLRCHGDYHLGQVLWADGDFIILDFEGEPTRSVEERRAMQSPLKDVAGMLRSFHYAAYAGLFASARDDTGEFDRLEPWADLWQQWVSAAFLRAYRETAAGAAFLPAEPGRFAALLDAFMLDKASYELAYELNNRPDWVRIPLRGILALLEQEAGGRSRFARNASRAPGEYG
jgi:maltose alpha-D-glucosyltransferase/alpha-amylase